MFLTPYEIKWYIYAVVGKKLVLCFVILFWSVATLARENSIWSRYVKTQKIEYKNYSQLKFEEISQRNLELPAGLNESRDDLMTSLDVGGKSYREDEVDFKILYELMKRGISDPYELKNLSVQEILALAIDITQKSMVYQLVRTHEPISGYQNINSVDCFLEGCGVCYDYAHILPRVFYWLKPYHPGLKNVFVFYTSGYTFEDPIFSNKTNDFLKKGFSNRHAWNIIVYFTDQKMVYSHIDITGPTGELGRFNEGRVGYHLSQNENENLAQLLLSLGEPATAVKLFKRTYRFDTGLPMEVQIQRMHRLIEAGRRAGDENLVCQYYKKIFMFIPEKDRLERVASDYCGSAWLGQM